MNTMPKFVIVLLTLIGSVVYLRAQTNTFPTSGNVGIGTQTPQQALDLGDGTAGRSIVWGGDGSNWYASIGTSYSSASLNLLSGLKLGAIHDNYLISYSGTSALSGIRLDSHNGDISFFGQPRGLFVAETSFDYAANTKLIVKADGDVGVGTTAPAQKLEVNGGVRSTRENLSYQYLEMDGGDAGGINLRAVSTENNQKPFNIISAYATNPGAAAGNRDIVFSSGELPHEIELVRIQPSGNVGIGTTNPTQKLSVNGTVRAKEVIVDSGWSDFVLDESYKLKALSETEAFIKAEKHLPGIPSAQDVAEHGVSVGEMQAKLLAKIEELTLHQIEQGKDISSLRIENDHLSRENARIQNRLGELERH